MINNTPDDRGSKLPDTPQSAAHHVRLPGFIIDHEVGFGDVIKHVTTAMGVKPCGNCEERARRLNRWMVFTPKRGG